MPINQPPPNLDVTPRRTYRFTDTIGGPLDPLNRPDPDRLLTETIRSSHGEIDDGVNIYGRTGVSAYLVAEAARLHGEPDNIVGTTKTLLVCNGAPRTGGTAHGVNGSDFYTGIVGDNLQIIGHADVFRHVRDQLDTYFLVPEGKYWPEGCQYRSSYVARAGSDPKHLKSASIGDIPRPAAAEVGLIDAYGSIKIVARDHAGLSRLLEEESIESRSGETRGLRMIGLTINDVKLDVALALDPNETLAHVTRAGAKTLELYKDRSRGGRHTLVWPWHEKSTVGEQRANSPCRQFNITEQSVEDRGSPEGEAIMIR